MIHATIKDEGDFQAVTITDTDLFDYWCDQNPDKITRTPNGQVIGYAYGSDPDGVTKLVAADDDAARRLCAEHNVEVIDYA